MNKSIFKKWWFWVLVAIAFISALSPLALKELTTGERVAYLGTLLGSVATIFAVVMTINYSRKSQINAFRAELERDRKEKWFAEAKDVFACAINSLDINVFTKTQRELTPSNTNEKKIELMAKHEYLLEICDKFSWFFTAIPMIDSREEITTINEELVELFGETYAKWTEVMNIHIKYYELFASLNHNDETNETIIKPTENLFFELGNYSKLHRDLHIKFIEQAEKLRKLIDQEYENILKDN